MPRSSPIIDTLHQAILAAGPDGITVKDLTLAIGGIAGEWAVNKQAGKLAQSGRAARRWEYFEVDGLKGPIGRWRYYAA